MTIAVKIKTQNKTYLLSVIEKGGVHNDTNQYELKKKEKKKDTSN